MLKMNVGPNSPHWLHNVATIYIKDGKKVTVDSDAYYDQGRGFWYNRYVPTFDVALLPDEYGFGKTAAVPDGNKYKYYRPISEAPSDVQAVIYAACPELEAA